MNCIWFIIWKGIMRVGVFFLYFFRSLDSWSLGWAVRVIANLNVKIDCLFYISLSVPIATETNQHIQTLKLFFRVSFIFIVQFLWNFRSDLVLSVDRFSLMNRSHQFWFDERFKFPRSRYDCLYCVVLWAHKLHAMTWWAEKKIETN